MTILNIREPAAAARPVGDNRGLLAVNLGLVTNLFLSIIKTTIGIIGHSPALLADGINSTSDVAYGLVVSIFMRLSRKPADHDHPFGHSQFETIAALTVGSFVLTTAVSIFWGAISTLFDQLTGQIESTGASHWAFWVALFTVGLKLVLYTYTKNIGRSANNAAVMALACDHRNDIFSATAALIGITLGRAGFPWVDPLAGALVALVILRTGVQILRQSAAELMDTIPGQALEQQVRQILQAVPNICQVEDIHAHRFGPYLVMNITVGVDGSITVAEGDRIATEAETRLKHAIDFLQVAHIHYHPAAVR